MGATGEVVTAHPHQSHSPTSRAAAQAIGVVAGTQKQAIIAALRIFGELSDEAIARHTGLNPSSARPRRVELLRDGVIEAGSPTVTSSGRKAQTWRLVPDADQLRLM